jgi:acyl carrier protein
MTYEEYTMVVQPKVSGVWNIQHALESVNQKLDFFINLSSVSSVVGNFHQAAYAAGGSFMAGFAQYMQGKGIPCSTIDLAPVKGIGYLTTDARTSDIVGDLFGNEWIDANDIHGLLASAISGEMKSSCSNHCITGLGAIRKQYQDSRMPWTRDPRFSHLVRQAELADTTSQSEAAASTASTLCPGQAVLRAQSHLQAQKIVAEAFLQTLARILMTSVEELDPNKSISFFGLDSLVAVEVRYWITREFDAALQLLQILTSNSAYELANLILQKSTIVPENLKPEGKAEKA